MFALKSIFLSSRFLYGSMDKTSLRAHLANTLWLDSSDVAVNPELQKLNDKAFVDVLLKDPRADRFAESFLMRHLKVDDMTKGIDPATAADRYKLLNSMGNETRLFITDIFKNDRPISDLIMSKTSFVNSDLAKIYGMSDPGQDFVKVALPNNRQGLMTQASVLTITSKPTETNIISRGLWIVEKVLCQQIPAPPNVQALPPSSGSQPTTPRQQLEAHRASPACASCHNLMDPAGFALENFGPVGTYRDQYDNGLPVDTTAEFADKTVTKTSAEFFAYIGKHKDDFSKCFARELLTYVMRRSLSDADSCAVDTLSRGMSEKNWGMQTSLNQILSWYEK